MEQYSSSLSSLKSRRTTPRIPTSPGGKNFSDILSNGNNDHINIEENMFNQFNSPGGATYSPIIGPTA